MRKQKKTMIKSLLALITVSVFLFIGVLTAYANEGDENPIGEALPVNEPAAENTHPISEPRPINTTQTAQIEEPTESALFIPQGVNPTRAGNDLRPGDDLLPFTPDGMGTVINNVADSDGKEFFTVQTPDGNVFYLIIDRHRNSQNVYLLNAVTEDDLASLAFEGDGKRDASPNIAQSAVQIPSNNSETPEPAENKAPQTETPAPENSNNTDTSAIAIIIVAVLGVGGIGYYFKIIRPKKNAVYEDDSDGEDFDDDKELNISDDDYDNDNGEGDYE
jgi:hypothetical protein